MSTLETWQQHLAERPWRMGFYAFAVVALATVLLLAVDSVLRPDHFPVRHLSFEGPFHEVDQQTLTAAVMDSVRGNFFLLNLDAIRDRARAVPWVYEASVQRQWPDGVRIRFSEQQLVARWDKSGWVNAQGDYVDLHGQQGPQDLPVLSGPPGLQARLLEHYRQLNEILAPAQLQITALTLTDRHSLDIVLQNGLQLTLGREEPEAKIERFARVYPQTLAAQAARVKRVDLRYTNGFSVEWTNRLGAPRTGAIMATGLKEG